MPDLPHGHATYKRILGHVSYTALPYGHATSNGGLQGM